MAERNMAKVADAFDVTREYVRQVMAQRHVTGHALSATRRAAKQAEREESGRIRVEQQQQRRAALELAVEMIRSENKGCRANQTFERTRTDVGTCGN